MKKELFEELLESVREGGKILRGEIPASRSSHSEELDIHSLLEKQKQRQSQSVEIL